jgi:hypothetical protein
LIRLLQALQTNLENPMLAVRSNQVSLLFKTIFIFIFLGVSSPNVCPLVKVRHDSINLYGITETWQMCKFLTNSNNQLITNVFKSL